MADFIDLTGLRYGRLFIVQKTKSIRGQTYYMCRCDCGNEKEIRGAHIKHGATKSCGCLRHIGYTITHGMSQTDEFKIWAGILSRCTNPNRKSYKDYGGRGIKVSPSWETFENFYTDMGPRPSKKHSIDRIDVDSGYSSENCRWATSRQQNQNRRDSKRLTAFGHTFVLTEWARRINVSQPLLHRAMKKETLEDYIIRKKGQEYVDTILLPEIANAQTTTA